MRLWQRNPYRFHKGGYPRGNLQRLPSVLHRHQENIGHRRKSGEIPGEASQSCSKDHEGEKGLAYSERQN